MMTQLNRPQLGGASSADFVPHFRRNSQRVTITMSWALHQKLIKRSDQEGRSLSNLLAYLIERSCQE